MNLAFEKAEVLNPKRNNARVGASRPLYPYYAGYSPDFASKLLQSLDIQRNAHILDPWNGAGTTTLAASNLGLRSTGTDISPVMVLIAKAALVGLNNLASIKPLAHEIVSLARYSKNIGGLPDPERDSLSLWFCPSSCYSIRVLEYAIQRLLIPGNYQLLHRRGSYSEISAIASFFYVCLFNILKRQLKRFGSSNPTWQKSPKSKRSRLRPSLETIFEEFLKEASSFSAEKNTEIDSKATLKEGLCDLMVCRAESLNLESNSADLVLTSPPYCTRIDYAVKTKVELAVLGIGLGDEFEEFRAGYTGTTKVGRTVPKINQAWGDECLKFLNQVYKHPSKASAGYYYKSHVAYYDSMYQSLKEIRRVTRPEGGAILVVQTSHYKDVLNDLPKIISEMGESVGMKCSRRDDFPVVKDMSRVNKASKVYRSSYRNYESVLFLKNHGG
jgi:DNA modification methylase